MDVGDVVFMGVFLSALVVSGGDCGDDYFGVGFGGVDDGDGAD